MSIPNAERLIENAQKGEKIGTKDRRFCVSYIMSCMATLSNREIGEIFKVTERAIREDKRIIREEKAAVISEDDIGLVIADIVLTYDNQIRDIERCKKAAKAGSVVYLSCCRNIFDMQTKKVEALQNLGYYPKNLGNMTVERYEYVGIASKDGSVETRPVGMFDAVSERNMETIDAEFTDVKLIEAPGAVV